MKRARWLCTLLGAVLLLSLTACGGDKPEEAEKDPNLLKLGSYDLRYKSASIMTDSDGKDALVLTMDFTNHSEETRTYIWSLTETAVQNGKELEFTVVFLNEESLEMVSDNQMADVAPGETQEIQTAFQLADRTHEVEITFAAVLGDESGTITVDPSKLGSDAASDAGGGAGAAAAADQEEPAAHLDGTGDILLEWWNGDWYGWWVMTECTGYYADQEMEGGWWDICGTIEIGENYKGVVYLWDEDYTKSDLMVEAMVSLSPDGTGPHGTLTSEGGEFTNAALKHADWIIDPGLVKYENMMRIEGDYRNGADGYHYDIILRPWGTYWDDVEEEDMLPGFYNDWYLPLIEAYKDMPDAIG